MLKSSKCWAFLSCLEFAIKKSFFAGIVLKPKQVLCLEKIFLGRDTLVVLPTGYGKSLIYYLAPALLFAKKNGAKDVNPDGKITSIVIVISPLNALIKNQIDRLSLNGIEAAVLDVKSSASITCHDDGDFPEEEAVVWEFQFGTREKLEKGHYNIVFAHPEFIISSKDGRKLMQSKPYQENVCALVIDEAHCILEWGQDFRVDYGNLAVVSAIFSSSPVIAMTATASRSDREAIKCSLGLEGCAEIIGNPDRRNITYYKGKRTGQDIDSLIEILTPIAEGLTDEMINFPLTIIYLPLKWCGFAYKIFESVLGHKQYYPEGSLAIPQNRLFAQFHSPQTKDMKDEILKQLCSEQSVIRVVFATVALGMGVDIKGIRQVIHITPPYTIQAYCQETGRAGRDGEPASAFLYYSNRDIAKNKAGMQDAVRTFCKVDNQCLRRCLLVAMDTEEKYLIPVTPKHACCSFCLLQCDCSLCKK